MDKWLTNLKLIITACPSALFLEEKLEDYCIKTPKYVWWQSEHAFQIHNSLSMKAFESVLLLSCCPWQIPCFSGFQDQSHAMGCQNTLTNVPSSIPPSPLAVAANSLNRGKQKQDNSIIFSISCQSLNLPPYLLELKTRKKDAGNRENITIVD